VPKDARLPGYQRPPRGGKGRYRDGHASAPPPGPPWLRRRRAPTSHTLLIVTRSWPFARRTLFFVVACLRIRSPIRVTIYRGCWMSYAEISRSFQIRLQMGRNRSVVCHNNHRSTTIESLRCDEVYFVRCWYLQLLGRCYILCRWKRIFRIHNLQLDKPLSKCKCHLHSRIDKRSSRKQLQHVAWNFWYNLRLPVRFLNLANTHAKKELREDSRAEGQHFSGCCPISFDNSQSGLIKTIFAKQIAI
jgi:hypothetical protein